MHEDANPKPAPPSDKEPLSHTLYRRFGRICRIVGGISLVLYGVAVARSIATREGSLSFSVLFHGDHVGLLCLFILAMVLYSISASSTRPGSSPPWNRLPTGRTANREMDFMKGSDAQRSV